jgi:hypothetical protein
MIVLRFPEELYDGFAVDAAAKMYGDFGAIELVREPGTYVVQVSLRDGAESEGIDEATLAAELANYALGATAERRDAPAAPPAEGRRP